MTYDNDKGITLHQGDCIEVMATLPADSVDSIVCDPPYGLEFMGKAWDAPWKDQARAASATTVEPASVGGFQDGNGGNAFSRSRVRTDTARHGGDVRTANAGFQAWCQQWATEALRVLKPGGHLLAFGGTRTYHRLACGIEDAGFEVRDSIHWIYGSGFPKSLDVSKAIDKAAGAEREVQQWQGWGTALKPAHEPVIVARKPLIGTVAANVQAYGTGALNIDGCRIGFSSEADEAESKDKNRHADFGSEAGGNAVYGDYSMVDSKNYDPPGRWPANVILTHSEGCVEVGQAKDTFGGGAKAASGFVNGYEGGDGFAASEATVAIYECVDGCPVKELDEQSGDTSSPWVGNARGVGAKGGQMFGGSAQSIDIKPEYADNGGASRFFYVAKAGTAERNEGLDGEKNTHPTVKPVALMRYLCKLVTHTGGTVLDPFAGSGTCGVAAIREGFNYIGIEMTPEYVEIAIARLESAATYLAEPQAMF